MKKPKVLFVDIETSPILGSVWALFDQNVGLNQIEKDWHVLSWAAKWAGEKNVVYMDQSHARNVEDDRYILKGVWKLLDEAEVVVGQNSKRFDIKKLNARFIINGMKPPSPFRQIDTLQIAKKHFGFTSNKLEYMSGKLCPDEKKLTKREFAGFELWKECLAGNKAAWAEMKRYNIQDVIALEAVYNKLQPWDNTTRLYSGEADSPRCNCGSYDIQRRGFNITNAGKFQRYQCQDCGAWYSDKDNLVPREQRQSRLK
jgi:uncharacterized protein YprB with RNaseH-like and TPR domain